MEAPITVIKTKTMKKQHLSYKCPLCNGDSHVTTRNGFERCNTCKGMGRILQFQMNKHKNKNHANNTK